MQQQQPQQQPLIPPGRNESFLDVPVVYQQGQPPLAGFTAAQQKFVYDQRQPQNAQLPVIQKQTMTEHLKAGYYGAQSHTGRTMIVCMNEFFAICAFAIFIGATSSGLYPIFISPIVQGIFLGALTGFYYFWGGIHINPMFTIAAAFHQPLQISQTEEDILTIHENGVTYNYPYIDENGESKIIPVLTRGDNNPLTPPGYWKYIDDNARAIKSQRSYTIAWMTLFRLASQVAGFFLGWLFLKTFVAGTAMSSTACFIDPGSTTNWGVWDALLVETVGTAFVVGTSLLALTLRAPLTTVSLMVTLSNICAILAFYQVSGSCFNPLRALAANLISSTWDNGILAWSTTWVYFVGPLLGCALIVIYFYFVKWLYGIKGASFMCVPQNWKDAGLMYRECEVDQVPLQPTYGVSNPFGWTSTQKQQ